MDTVIKINIHDSGKSVSISYKITNSNRKPPNLHFSVSTKSARLIYCWMLFNASCRAGPRFTGARTFCLQTPAPCARRNWRCVGPAARPSRRGAGAPCREQGPAKIVKRRQLHSLQTPTDRNNKVHRV